MKLQMVDLARQYQAHKAEIDAALTSVLEQAAYIRGKAVDDFEAALGAWLGTGHVISCASGTDALQIAFMALDIGHGDEVITTPFSFVAAVEAMVLLGARPVFVDIDPCTYNLNVEQVKACITPRTRAVVPVHLYGQPADMEPLLALGRTHGLAIVEDTAQAIGAQSGGRYAGTLGDIGCFSFFPAKNLGCFGDGGALVVKTDELAARCRMIANHGARVRYQHERVGINSRLDTLQAAVLLAKLPHLHGFNEARRRAAAVYDRAFAGLPVITPFVASGGDHVYQQYTLRCLDGTRDRLAEFLRQRGVPTAVHYPRALHQQKAFAGLVPATTSCPEAERAAREVLSLPIFPEISEAELSFVIEGVRAFFG